ncbi:YraN family protein [Zoogloea sp.]|uniref:YraN family protein n=1 Tax=Zoogloea sp. TaxID=49181 RepID=UPI00260807EA|nr:YraN family protein [Zoogloea sp.]MDD3352281.1 YraN family protein [Zoogloea sp.]
MAGEPDCGDDAPPAQAEHLRRGAAAEALAAEYLVRHGLTLLARNVRCRGGEVDLIAGDRGSLVFVEVRLRSNRDFGGAAASITVAKQRRIILAAQYWLLGPGRRFAQAPCRFDAVLLDRLEQDRIEWIRGAFDAS